MFGDAVFTEKALAYYGRDEKGRALSVHRTDGMGMAVTMR